MTLDPALRLLLRLKWRGFWRKQWRRVRSPSGALLALCGAVVLAGWLLAMGVHLLFDPGGRTNPEDAELMVSIGMAVLAMLTLSNALSFRGLYLPPSEIETLFSAPLSRTSILRMRLAVGFARSLFGAVFAGLAAMRLANVPAYGLAGALAALLWLPVVGQGLSVLFGGAENRIAVLASRLPHRALRALWLGLILVLFVTVASSTDAADLDGPSSPLALARQLRDHPVGGFVLGLFWPWARSISAGSAREFWPAFAAALAVFGATLAAVSHLRVDYRETALATSAELAKRLARIRRGLGAGGVQARKLPATWRTPWLFGRGPFGAIAYRKTASILRKARGGLLFGVVVITVVTILAPRISNGARDAAASAAMVAVFGSFYLCLGMRHDFREELDSMASIRAWPLASWRIFVATIAPQVVVICALVLAGVAVTLARAPRFDPGALVVIALAPLLVATWVSIDNIAFLLAPSRTAPGQEGALQHAGRAFVLILLRGLALLVVLLPAAAPMLIASAVLAWPADRVAWVGLLFGGAALLVELAGLAWLGGAALRRFDVARER